MRVNKKDSQISILNTIILCWPCGLVLLCFLFLSAECVEAVTPQIWKQNSQDAFEKGDVKGLSLTREGTLSLGPQWDLVADTGEQFVWSLASDRKGTLYIGTGIEGRIYALKKGQQQPELIFDDEEETKIFALTVGGDGALYAGTSPNGLVYRIVSGKPAEVFCETGDLHVWALVWGNGQLYAATGGEYGRILKLSKNKVEEIYQTEDPNVVSLTVDAKGALYAGTDQKGLIYKVSDQGQVSVFYDAGEKEVHALTVKPNGMVYATAMVGRSEGKKNGNDEGKKSVLYAIRPSGSALRLWETDDPLLLSVTEDVDGSVRVVTGKDGRVYRIWPDGTYTLMAQFDDVYPWAVLPTADGGLWIGSSGDGQVFKLGSRYVSEGTLTSEVKDFTLVSYWGQVHWQAETPSGTSVRLQTRSGNSEEPDNTWSSWSSELKSSGDQISSPPARFLQYRLILKASSDYTPRVRDVRLSGVQENIAPMVLSVTVSQGDENGDPNRDRRSFWKISWESGDVNDDSMTYIVSFRNVGSTRWFVLEEDLRTPQFVWDTETVPDGTVQVRVVASDQNGNPAGKALVGEAVSLPFDIDNTPPKVTIQSVTQNGAGQVQVLGKVADEISAVVSGKYALNSGDWEVVFARDGIFDSAEEMLQFPIANLKPGAYTLVVQVEDAVGNVGLGKTTFDVK